MMERAYRHIRASLAAGQFAPGAQLSETELAQQIGVSRTPIREAFLLLENEGFIEQVPRYGTFVKNAARHERQALYELREVLEAYAAGKAAVFINEATIRKLRQLCEEMRSALRAIRDSNCRPDDDVLSRMAIADIAFHMLILRASGNPLVIRSVGDLHLMSRIWGGDRWDLRRRALAHWVRSWQEHMRIYLAIRRRDPQSASYWMQVHLRRATTAALENYDLQCRAQGAEAVAYEWPKGVRDAISHMEQFGPDQVTD